MLAPIRRICGGCEGALLESIFAQLLGVKEHLLSALIVSYLEGKKSWS